jgi:hypothetical protein
MSLTRKEVLSSVRPRPEGLELAMWGEFFGELAAEAQKARRWIALKVGYCH